MTQFCGNYNFVYRAELHLTSGIVAVMIALLLVPNTILGRFLLNQVITRRFAVGSVIAIAGIALLLLHEAREAPVQGKVFLGVGFALLYVVSGSIALPILAHALIDLRSLVVIPVVLGSAWKPRPTPAPVTPPTSPEPPPAPASE